MIARREGVGAKSLLSHLLVEQDAVNLDGSGFGPAAVPIEDELTLAELEANSIASGLNKRLLEAPVTPEHAPLVILAARAHDGVPLIRHTKVKREIIWRQG
jgi:hypothetical protein